MNMITAAEIETLLAVGELGISEELLKDGRSVGIHLTIKPDNEGGPPCIDLSTWKRMSTFRLVAAKNNLRRLAGTHNS